MGKTPTYSNTGHCSAGVSPSLLSYFALIRFYPSGTLSYLFLEVRVTCFPTEREQLALEQSLITSTLCLLALGPGGGVAESWGLKTRGPGQSSGVLSLPGTGCRYGLMATASASPQMAHC